MTSKHNLQRETTDLLERILEHVESIDKTVEDLRDGFGDRFGDFVYRNAYDEPEDRTGYG
jgi:hypothetical protein